MLFNISNEGKGIPFILVKRYGHPYDYGSKCKMFYDYEDDRYYLSGNSELVKTYSKKHIQKTFKKLTKKANTKIEMPEAKIYLKFDKPNRYGITQWEIHKGIGVLTEIGVDGRGTLTDITLLTYYPDWSDISGQPKRDEYKFNKIKPFNLDEGVNE